MNRSGAPVTIANVVARFPDQWFYTSCAESNPSINCNFPFGNGQFVQWVSNFNIPNGQQVVLTVVGHYATAGKQCRADTDYTVTDSNGAVILGNSICVDVP